MPATGLRGVRRAARYGRPSLARPHLPAAVFASGADAVRGANQRGGTRRRGAPQPLAGGGHWLVGRPTGCSQWGWIAPTCSTVFDRGGMSSGWRVSGRPGGSGGTGDVDRHRPGTPGLAGPGIRRDGSGIATFVGDGVPGYRLRRSLCRDQGRRRRAESLMARESACRGRVALGACRRGVAGSGHGSSGLSQTDTARQGQCRPPSLARRGTVIFPAFPGKSGEDEAPVRGDRAGGSAERISLASTPGRSRLRLPRVASGTTDIDAPPTSPEVPCVPATAANDCTRPVRATLLMPRRQSRILGPFRHCRAGRGLSHRGLPGSISPPPAPERRTTVRRANAA